MATPRKTPEPQALRKATRQSLERWLKKSLLEDDQAVHGILTDALKGFDGLAAIDEADEKRRQAAALNAEADALEAGANGDA